MGLYAGDFIDFGDGVRLAYNRGTGKLQFLRDGVDTLDLSSTERVASGVQAANITDAEEAHALNSTFSDTEVEAALDALGTKINAVLAALEAFGIAASA